MIKKVIPQMFDVRPLDKNGNLDFEKIGKIEKKEKPLLPKIPEIKTIKNIQRVSTDIVCGEKDPWLFSGPATKKQTVFEKPELPKRETSQEAPAEIKIKDYFKQEYSLPETSFIEQEQQNYYNPKHPSFCIPSFPTAYIPPVEKKKKRERKTSFNFSKAKSFFESLSISGTSEIGVRRPALSFARAAVLVFLIFFGTAYTYKSLNIKGMAENNGQAALIDLVQAKEGISAKDFNKSSFEFSEAYDRFDEISKDVDSLGAVVVEASRFLPYASKLSSGKYLAQSGKDISQIGILSSEIMQSLEKLKNPFNDSGAESEMSLLKIFQDTNNNLKKISVFSEDLENNINKVNAEDIPEDKREMFIQLRQKLPEVNEFAGEFLGSSEIFTDILGGNGPRKYLFLFQNNNEMRATGGFIGTYGVLDIFNGRIKKFYIDGIFNPDGQLTVDVVPPAPIQKISGGWSLHDSNWFPDFPKSAEKAIWFFEKTGGPTVDGVITMTPEVMKNLLEITGPIEMEEYGITVDRDNFTEQVQDEVENKYDKELNQPKKILADLAPKILDKIFNARSASDMARTVGVLEKSLNEKQLLLYSANLKIEQEISKRGWSGELLKTQKDYLSVINSNINGYKTDGVVDEKIEHQAEIQEDGSVVDTVIITRKHNGGNSSYEWFNKVNANYMRVYVPMGSKLISAEGQSREFNSPMLDYDSLKFKRDPQVQMEENSINIDEQTGTRIYEDSGKTVFANWVYVSPQETVVMKYKYLLPFKIDLNSENKPVDAYSLLAQKQSGSRGSVFDSKVIFPENYKVVWKYPDASNVFGNKLQFDGDLKKDKFVGVAFQRK